MPKKRALVTGASRGLGRAIAARFARDGFVVSGTATSAEGAARIAADLAKISSDNQGLVLDLAQVASIDKLGQMLKEQDQMPDVLVANAGITDDDLVLRMKTEQWQRVLDVNLTGTFLLCRLVLRAMMKQRWGRILLLGSVVGHTGNVGQANYAAAKAGLAALGRSLALEFASRTITVNTLAPGFIQTDMTANLDERMRNHMLAQIPLHRYGTVEEVAAAASFLVSDEASYITGQVLHINGGMYMN